MSQLTFGSRIGVLGGGQLARMLAQQAIKMGYECIVYTDSEECPARYVATKTIVAKYTDLLQLKKFIADVDVVTFEFESIPINALSELNQQNKFKPSLDVFKHTQNRIAEKNFLKNNNLPHLPYWSLPDIGALKSIEKELIFPLVFKTAFGGYDGKGQHIVENMNDLKNLYTKYHGQKATLELFIELDCEVSVIVVRDEQKNIKTFGPIQNQHKNHILDISFCPAKTHADISDQAIGIARRVAECLDLVGLICVEFFIDKNQSLFINEIAPRTHNSGHLTIEAATESQFEQQIRAICGLDLGEFKLKNPTAMGNLLGELWANGEPKWQSLLSYPQAYLHLYQKKSATTGRKMGHVTVTCDDVDSAIKNVNFLRQAITK